jgi:hypothetical protein
MGAAFYIVLETEIDGLDTMMDGKMLARKIDALDPAAKQQGVRPLSEFISMDAEAASDILGDDLAGIDVPPVKYFSAQEGLATVRALLSRPEAQPALQDLKDCERILCAAAQHSIGWHLQVDI